MDAVERRGERIRIVQIADGLRDRQFDGPADQCAGGVPGADEGLDDFAADLAGGSGDEDHRRDLPKCAACIRDSCGSWS